MVVARFARVKRFFWSIFAGYALADLTSKNVAPHFAVASLRCLRSRFGRFHPSFAHAHPGQLRSSRRSLVAGQSLDTRFFDYSKEGACLVFCLKSLCFQFSASWLPGGRIQENCDRLGAFRSPGVLSDPFHVRVIRK